MGFLNGQKIPLSQPHYLIFSHQCKKIEMVASKVNPRRKNIGNQIKDWEKVEVTVIILLSAFGSWEKFLYPVLTAIRDYIRSSYFKKEFPHINFCDFLSINSSAVIWALVAGLCFANQIIILVILQVKFLVGIVTRTRQPNYLNKCSFAIYMCSTFVCISLIPT